MGLFSNIVQYALFWSLKELGIQKCSPHDISRSESQPIIQISPSWDVLGPFQIGTREAAWSADPLEYHGGFSSLKPDLNTTFSSSLTRDGRVRWSRYESSLSSKNQDGSKVKLVVTFPDTVNWPFLQQVYGWAATQWQAWARTDLTIDSDRNQTVLLYTGNALEYVLDGQRYFGGDFFGYRRAPAVLSLAPGRHTFDVRLVRDVRAMGGIGLPSIEVNLEAVVVKKPSIHVSHVLVSDVIDGRFASPYGSFTITNTKQEWITVEISSAQTDDFSARILHQSQARVFHLAPGQTRPLAAYFELHKDCLAKADVQLSMSSQSAANEVETLKISLPINPVSRYEAHKVTHMYSSGIVSYAIMRPPSKNATCSPAVEAAPILAALHGAGVEADSSIVREAFDALPDLCAWILMPSGLTTWSGDDWHTWGYLDLQIAISMLPVWLMENRWEGINVDTSKILLTGHSNGGQGVWYGLTHYPDKLIAAAPLSGYISIPSYVPTTFWHPADPSKRSVVNFAMASFSHDLLVSNFAHIPVFQQHGELDDNVPVFHSSLMHQLIEETDSESVFDVVTGAGHWWKHVTTEPKLADFYRHALKNPHVKTLGEVDEFELVVADPGDMGGRFGVRVLYLQEQGKLGRLKVQLDRERDVWRITPKNIMAFELPDDGMMGLIEIYDEFGGPTLISPSATPEKGTRTIWRCNKTRIWSSIDPPYPPTRRSNHFGGLSAILRVKSSPFYINATVPELLPLALQISRNFNTYYGADTEIITSPNHTHSQFHNDHTIILAIGPSLPISERQQRFPIRISSSHDHLEILSQTGDWQRAAPRESQGSIFMRPGPNEGLEIVVWGSNLAMAEQVARLIPMKTGTGQPDWIICRKEMMWKGIEGCDMGWFDAWWQIQA